MKSPSLRPLFTLTLFSKATVYIYQTKQNRENTRRIEGNERKEKKEKQTASSQHTSKDYPPPNRLFSIIFVKEKCKGKQIIS